MTGSERSDEDRAGGPGEPHVGSDRASNGGEPPPTGVIPGSIGDLSTRLGQDVRELLMDGKDLSDIHAMIDEREQRRRAEATGDGRFEDSSPC